MSAAYLQSISLLQSHSCKNLFKFNFFHFDLIMPLLFRKIDGCIHQQKLKPCFMSYMLTQDCNKRIVIHFRVQPEPFVVFLRAAIFNRRLLFRCTPSPIHLIYPTWRMFKLFHGSAYHSDVSSCISWTKAKLFLRYIQFNSSHFSLYRALVVLSTPPLCPSFLISYSHRAMIQISH